MKRLFTTTIIMLLTGAALFATDKRPVYRMSRIGDNWSLTVGGGINTIYDNRKWGLLSPAVEFQVGKWLTPAIGVSIGAHGWENGTTDRRGGWFSAADRFRQYMLDGDVLWDFTNTVAGYREARVWHLIPYARFAWIATASGDGVGNELGIGAGIRNSFRINKRVYLNIDVAAVGAREKAYRETGNIIAFPSATAGVTVKVGRVGWRRVGESRYTDDDYEKLLAEYMNKPAPEPEVIRDTVYMPGREVERETMLSTPLTLYFDINQSVLTDREKAHLERYAEFVLKNPDIMVLLIGSADKETGTSSGNQKLSEDRAAHVKSILITEYGLHPWNIEILANGDRVNEFNTPEKNRCVTLKLIEEDKYKQIIK